MNEKDESKLQAWKMTFLRSLIDCTRRDLIWNEDVCDELGIYKITNSMGYGTREFYALITRALQ